MNQDNYDFLFKKSELIMQSAVNLACLSARPVYLVLWHSHCYSPNKCITPNILSHRGTIIFLFHWLFLPLSLVLLEHLYLSHDHGLSSSDSLLVPLSYSISSKFSFFPASYFVHSLSTACSVSVMISLIGTQ